jgi:excisionase family DNA binding protein
MRDGFHESARKRLFTVVEAASYLSLSASTLNRLRVNGGGPRYAKLGGKILYDLRDLDQWIEDSKRASTSDNRHERDHAA